MKHLLVALAAMVAFGAASAAEIGIGIAGAGGTSASGGGAFSGGQQGSAILGVSAGQQQAGSAGISRNTTLVNSTGGVTTSEHEDVATSSQVGGSLGLAAQTGASGAGSLSQANGGFGLLKGFIFANP